MSSIIFSSPTVWKYLHTEKRQIIFFYSLILYTFRKMQHSTQLKKITHRKQIIIHVSNKSVTTNIYTKNLQLTRSNIENVTLHPWTKRYCNFANIQSITLNRGGYWPNHGRHYWCINRNGGVHACYIQNFGVLTLFRKLKDSLFRSSYESD